MFSLILLLLCPVLATVTPGFQFLGYGYDLLFGNPRSTKGDGDPGFRTNIYDFSYNDGMKTADGKWDVPDKTTSQDYGWTCTTTQNSKILYSGLQYQNLVNTDISLDGSFLGIQFSLSTDFTKINAQTRNRTNVFAQIEARCTAYSLTLHTFDHPPVDNNFVMAVTQFLPDEFDMEKYVTVIQNFGTHVVTALQVGGRWGWQMSFKMTDWTSMLDNELDVSGGISFAGKVKAGLEINSTNHIHDYIEVVNKIFSNETFSVGGTFSPDVNVWMKSIRNYPMPTKLTLMSLHKLMTPMWIPDANAASLKVKAANMKKAIEGWCAYFRDHLSANPKAISCEPPQSVPEPRPHPVAANAVRRICVTNYGGYAMSFVLKDLTTQYPVDFQTGYYSRGDQRCIDGVQIGADIGDRINCRGMIMAGNQRDCSGPVVVFDTRANQQANYECNGSTYTGDCHFTHYSNMFSRVLMRREFYW